MFSASYVIAHRTVVEEMKDYIMVLSVPSPSEHVLRIEISMPSSSVIRVNGRYRINSVLASGASGMWLVYARRFFLTSFGRGSLPGSRHI